METLREASEQLAGARASEQNCAQKSGKTIVLKIAEAIRIPLSLDDFDLNASIAFDWRPDLRDAPGLVIANVENNEVAEILACASRNLGAPWGTHRIHETAWLGFATVQRLELLQPIDLAEAIEDSVLFGVDSPAGVDTWWTGTAVPGDEPFRLVAAGRSARTAVAPCFLGEQESSTATQDSERDGPRTGPQTSRTTSKRSSVMSLIALRTPSRPRPECFTPP